MRIAGVEVGKVTNVEHMDDSNLAVVTMEVKDDGLPIHEDATLKIRPRLFLEGNFFVDMTAGTPGRPTIDDGDTIPVTQTAYPVQLDQHPDLASEGHAQGPPEAARRASATASTHKPNAPRTTWRRTPTCRASPAGQALNDSLDLRARGGLKDAARVNEAFLGTEPRRPAQADRRPSEDARRPRPERGAAQGLLHQLQPHDGGARLGAGQPRARRYGLLGPTLEKADSYFGNFAEALPPTREFVRSVHPGRARRRRPRSTAAGPWLTQFTALVSRPELGGLLKDLQADDRQLCPGRQRVDRLQQADERLQPLLQQRHPAGRRRRAPGRRRDHRRSDLQGVLVPGRPASPARRQNFDGNGQYTRVQTGGGANVVKSGKLPGRTAVDAQLFGNAILPPLGTRPTRPDKKPPYKPKSACYKQKPPDLNGPAAAAGPPDARVGPMTRAIQKHLRDFIAILVMVVLAFAVGGYILSNQRFYLPGWVPVIGSDFFELKGEFADGTVGHAGPGPDGRHRRRAGRRRQEASSSTNGRAVITMTVKKKYADDDQEGRVHAAAPEDRASTT